MAKCKYCDKDIVWVKEGKRNVAIEDDGAKHKCEKMMAMRNSLKKFEVNDLSNDEIAKYEQAINDKK